MAFNEQSFAARYASMGDEAEQTFEQVWDGPWDRYGFNRPRSGVRGMSLRVRYTPDYKVHGGLVECQGFGKDRVLKVKHDKITAMRLWAADDPLKFFVWDRTMKRWTVVDWQVIDTLSMTPYMTGEYHDGNAFVGLHFDQLEHLPWNDKAT
jgi:hypothetical protein